MLYDPKWEVFAPAKPLDLWRSLLLEAAKIMDERGKCERVYRDCRGRVCVRGALHIALDGHPDDVCRPGPQEALKRAEFALCATLGVSNIWDAATWNNDRNRTKDEVVAVLRKAAASPQ
jgi:hypothetical protein